MCYCYINAVSWPPVQLDKKSCASSVNPPTQISNMMSVSPDNGMLLRSNEHLNVYCPLGNCFRSFVSLLKSSRRRSRVCLLASERLGVERLLSALLWLGHCDCNYSKPQSSEES